jgi:methylenetetrahydrofolate--tRNA-(uracil-5-)-methyltransferase
VEPEATVVGGGLAGCEAAYQLASRGVRVRLFEMKPAKRTPAQRSDGLCELVCSNSLRGAALTGAVGLLKEELRLAGSLILRAALASRVPAGGALAVDRELFSAHVTEALRGHPLIEMRSEEVTAIGPERPLVLATGPLTSPALAADLEARCGREYLSYYDAISPIVAADSIDWSVVWKQSRYDKGGDDYGNCPFDAEQYHAFVAAIVAAEKMPAHDFEEPRYFEGCLPCEVMAERGEHTLAFGPMKPVGLRDPRTGRQPYAVVQLRPEDAALSAYNLVGFQSRMKWPEQQRVFRMIPGLAEAEFMRLGAVHRNTFVDAPALLDETMQLRSLPGVYVAGQLSGVEGYVESCAGGLLAGIFLAARLRGEPLPRPAETTALGGILTHLGRKHPKASYQPSNITWAHIPPLEVTKKVKKRVRYQLMADRALADLQPWLAAIGSPEASGPPMTLPEERVA